MSLGNVAGGLGNQPFSFGGGGSNQYPPNPKAPCTAAATGNVTISNPGTAVFDGVTLTSGQSLLIPNQTDINQTQNGIYIFNGSSSALTRRSDSASWDSLVFATTYIQEGTLYQGTTWQANILPGGTIGINPIPWVIINDNTLPIGSTTQLGILQVGSYINVSAGLISLPQDVSTTAVPTFAGATYNGNVIINSMGLSPVLNVIGHDTDNIYNQINIASLENPDVHMTIGVDYNSNTVGFFGGDAGVGFIPVLMQPLGGSYVGIGSNGNQSQLQIFPATANNGYLELIATDSTGNFYSAITNANVGQDTGYELIDPGTNNAQFILTSALSGTQTIAGGLTVGYLPITGVTGATTASRIMGGVSGSAPITGTFSIGDVVNDNTGGSWTCTTGGSPGTWVHNSGGGTNYWTYSGGALSPNTGSGTILKMPNGNIMAGTGGPGNSGSLWSFANDGSALVLNSGQNSSIYDNFITNFSTGQQTTWYLIDPGQTTTSLIQSASLSGNQTISSQLTVGDLKVTGLTGANVASRYVGATSSGSPVSGTFAVGDYIIDQTGAIWICTVAGTPGTWVNTAGSGTNYWNLTGTVLSPISGTYSLSVPAGAAFGSNTTITANGGISLTINGANNTQLSLYNTVNNAQYIIQCVSTGQNSSSQAFNSSVNPANVYNQYQGGRTAFNITQDTSLTYAVTIGTNGSVSGLQASGEIYAVGDLKVGGLTGATAASRYVGATASGAPVSGTFAIGDYVIDQTGAIWICTVAGSPGTFVSVSGGTNYWSLTGSTLSPVGSYDVLLASTNTLAATNITIPQNGTQGYLRMYAPTAAHGFMYIYPTGNTGNFDLGITGISTLGQSTLITIPDPGIYSTNFVLTNSAIDTSIVYTGGNGLNIYNSTGTWPLVIGNIATSTNIVLGISGGTLATIGANNAGMTAWEDLYINNPAANIYLEGTTTFANNISINSTYSVTLDKGTGTEASNAVTINNQAGVITTSSLTTVGGGTYTITLTNSKITTSSVIIISYMGGTNTIVNAIGLSATAGSGTSTINIYNNSTVNPFNGTIILGFIVV